MLNDETETWTIPPDCSAIVQKVGVRFSPGGLTLLFERHPSVGARIPTTVELLFPPPIARPMLEALRRELDRDGRQAWLKSH